jgi:hypothetical protein
VERLRIVPLSRASKNRAIGRNEKGAHGDGDDDCFSFLAGMEYSDHASRRKREQTMWTYARCGLEGRGAMRVR